MVKKAKAKAGAKKAPSKTKAARPATRVKGPTKYEQAGAPWWKRTPLPQPKM